MFDGHRSIPKAISVVYSSVEHGLCYFYIFKNLKKTYKSTPIKWPFYSCARAYTTIEYEYYTRQSDEYYMRQLDDISPFIRIELEGLDKHKWCTTFSKKGLIWWWRIYLKVWTMFLKMHVNYLLLASWIYSKFDSTTVLWTS